MSAADQVNTLIEFKSGGHRCVVCLGHVVSVEYDEKSQKTTLTTVNGSKHEFNDTMNDSKYTELVQRLHDFHWEEDEESESEDEAPRGGRRGRSRGR